MADYIRGMNDVPLNLEGIQQAAHLGRRIRAKGGVNRVVTSPLSRAVLTGKIVVDHVPGSHFAYTNEALTPWHLGKFEGVESNQAHQELETYVRHPHRPVPGHGPASQVPGESFDTFLSRYYSALKMYLDTVKKDQERLALGVHYRNIKAALSCEDFDKMTVDPDKMTCWPDAVGTAHLFTVRRWGKGLSVQPVDLDNNVELPWDTLFLFRHGSTALNG